MNRANNLPPCPEGGGLVPDTFPVGAVVISDIGGKGKDSGFTAEVVQKILIAAGNNNPILILPVTNETIERVKAKIDELPITGALKKKYKKSIIQIPIQGYTWQQDYMQSFVNPTNGQIVIREVQGYSQENSAVQSAVKKIAVATKDCGFIQGPDLQTGTLVSGHAGGNIETLPAGICILGDDHFETYSRWEDYADQICNRGKENRIQVPTSWLQIGHTDEIMKVVRNKKAKEPCDFSVVLASPYKALELLKQNPNEKFLDFSKGRGESTRSLTIRRSNEYRGLRRICDEIIEQRNSPSNKGNEIKSKSSKAISKLLELKKILMSKAYARNVVIRGPENGEPEECSQMTNEQVYNVLTGESALSVYNKLIQKKMNDLKNEISQKLKTKLPQCEIDFIEVPDLFFGGIPVEIETGKFELPNKMGLSILPNPTNAISVNDTVISPDPSNGVFKRYIEEQYNKRGLAAEFVDTFDYAHQEEGNLHCSTNTIHICNPRRAK